MKKSFYQIVVCFFLFITSCSIGDYELKEESRSIAVPLANGILDLGDITDRAEGLASLRFDGEGKVTAMYSGNVLRDNAAKIFPPVPGALLEFPILDTNTLILLPVSNINNQYRIDKGIFGNTNIFFKFQHDEKELIKVVMRIPSVTKDGKVFEQQYNLDFTNDVDGEILTNITSVLGSLALPMDNFINFQYFAYKPNGERIKLKLATMKFDILQFSYLEGYFGNHSFDIKGDFIKINLFDKWVSGGVEILNPIIRLNVDNVFGFPVRSKVNQLYVKTVTGQTFNVESPFVTNGIDFNYPTIDEVGQNKRTEFLFTGANSNVGTLFQDKIVQVIYDFDALANPDGDIGVRNFFTADSYFSVSVDVELPMEIKSNLFTISDTVELKLDDVKDVKSGKLKVIASNGFPIDVKVNAEFLDANGNILEKLEGNEGFEINAANLGGDGKVSTPTTKEIIIEADENRFNNIINSKKVKLTASFDSRRISDKHIWIYKNYGLEMKIGAVINTK